MDSPFKEILHTNAVPSDPDCQRIRELLVGPQKEVAELTAEIERLLGLISQLSKKRDHLNDFITPHLALISPTRRLPADVVTEVFSACLPADRNAVMSGAEAPLLLCHVCRTWRSLALSIPRLWASLHIVAPGDTSKLLQISGAADSWLSRSGVLPLSISLVSWTSKNGTDSSVLVETLVHYSLRWKRVRFQLESLASCKLLAVLSPADAPILETIVFDGIRPRYDEAIDWGFVAFLGTASLQSVILRRLHSSLLPLPWNRLRHLSLTEGWDGLFSPAEALDLLRRCPNLITCGLEFNSDDENAPSPPACHMQHLRRLSVVDYMQLTADFFQNLDLPNLRSLEYSANHVERFLFRPLFTSDHNIQCLRLQVPHVTGEAMIDCLHLMPGLRELSLSHDPFSPEAESDTDPDAGADTESPTPEIALESDFWKSFTPTTQNLDSVLCPQLRVVNFLQFTHVSDQILLEFLRARTGSRFPGIAQLSKAHIQFIRPMEFDIVPELREAIRHGVDFALRYAHWPPGYSPSQGNREHMGEGESFAHNWASIPVAYPALKSACQWDYTENGSRPKTAAKVSNVTKPSRVLLSTVHGRVAPVIWTLQAVCSQRETIHTKNPRKGGSGEGNIPLK
ncbi:hypothetical protein B0H19DRAFT_1068488 [Mycena capillaripes]|nr:hypothetical protein B0H19DRAFT_1068488 [Mycena capillaripes]